MTRGPRPAKLESVRSLVTVVERAADDERARTTGLNTRAASVAGFSGTNLSLVATLGRNAFDLELGRIGTPIEASLFVLSLLAFASSVGFAVAALRARDRELLDLEAVHEFAEPQWVTMDPARIQHEWLVTLESMLSQDRANNDRRASRFKGAAAALLVGVLFVALQATILAAAQF